MSRAAGARSGATEADRNVIGFVPPRRSRRHKRASHINTTACVFTEYAIGVCRYGNSHSACKACRDVGRGDGVQCKIPPPVWEGSASSRLLECGVCGKRRIEAYQSRETLFRPDHAGWDATFVPPDASRRAAIVRQTGGFGQAASMRRARYSRAVNRSAPSFQSLAAFGLPARTPRRSASLCCIILTKE